VTGGRPAGVRAPAVVWAVVVAAAVACGWFLNSGTFSDAEAFGHAARVALSPDWRSTYGDPWLQAGPLELLVCVLGTTLGVTSRGAPIALNVIGAVAVLAVAAHVFGRRWREPAIVAGGALGVGIISDMWEWGHPSELFIALVWLLAARAARRDHMLAAACLLGVAAGFETWGLLGAPVLFLLPRLRSTVAAGFVALGVAASFYVPFALGGDFHMFDLHWAVVGGVPGYLFGDGTTFSWGMRLGEAVVVVGFGSSLALALRRRTAACVWLVPALTSICRLLLDPVRYGYYWDTSLILLLIGVAPWLASPRRAADAVAGALGRAVPVTSSA
jgi:hypothetical protein